MQHRCNWKIHIIMWNKPCMLMRKNLRPSTADKRNRLKCCSASFLLNHAGQRSGRIVEKRKLRSRLTRINSRAIRVIGVPALSQTERAGGLAFFQVGLKEMKGRTSVVHIKMGLRETFETFFCPRLERAFSRIAYAFVSEIRLQVRAATLESQLHLGLRTGN